MNKWYKATSLGVLLALAGCCTAPSPQPYAASFDEGFVDKSAATATAIAPNRVVRLEFCSPALPPATMDFLRSRNDNKDKQIWGKDKNYFGDGSYLRKAGDWNFAEFVVIGNEMQAYLNGQDIGQFSSAKYDAFAADKSLQFRNVRVLALPEGAVFGVACPKFTRDSLPGFRTYFGGKVADLKNWKGVTTEENFDNPIVRQAATPEKRAAMQVIADKGMREHWFVRNGNLFFDGFKGGYSLATDRDYEDFELWADWRILSITGDSGLYLRGAPQVQIWDAHNQWHIGSGGLYNNQKNPHDALVIADKRVGDWNRFHVIMKGDKVTVWLNGELVVDNVTLENYWDRKRPIFPIEQIELQCHGDPTEWRNIFIRELPVLTLPSNRVGVCSWSWQKPLKEVADAMAADGVKGIHLALGPFLNPDGRHGAAESAETLAFVKDQIRTGKWHLMSTMIGTVGEDYSTLESIRKTGGIVPDANWEANKKLVTAGAKLTKDLGGKYMSLHAGFLDEKDPAAFKKYVERVTWMRDEAAKYGVELLLESGQETATDLAAFMAKVPGVGINFDPANMVLYAKGKPMEAVKTLLPWIKQVHIKDALFTEKPGTWGTEVVWGDGEVGGRAFITELEKLGYKGNYIVEREGGNNRAGEIGTALERIRD